MPPKGHSGSTGSLRGVNLPDMKEQSPPKKLTRSRDDRFVGGVAAGIANRLDVDPLLVRIAFAASLIFGGLGLVIYLVLLISMPIEGDPNEPLPPIEPKRRNAMIGGAVAVGVVGVITASTGQFADWAFGFWPGTLFGILLWVFATVCIAWLLTAEARDRINKSEATPTGSGPPRTTPAASPAPRKPEPTEPVGPATFAEAPSQVPTEVMDTRPLEAAGSAAGPSAPGPAPKARSRDDGPSTIGRIMLWFAIGLSALTAFCILFVISAGTTAIFGGVPMAAVVIILGGGMVFAGLRGRRQVSLWLLTAAVAITIPMAAISIADLRIEGNYGDINETPLSVVDVPDDGFRMAAGNMTIDLRKFDFDRRRELDLPVKSGMGLTSIIVPDDVCVTGSVDGKVGVANIRGRQSSGLSISQSVPGPVNWKPGMAARGRTVLLDADFKVGAFEVVDNSQWRRNGPGGSFEDNGLEPGPRTSENARARAAAACAGDLAPERTPNRRNL